MVTLKELLERYAWMGLTDIEIIKLYFTKNNIADEAVDMLVVLSKEMIRDANDLSGYRMEHSWSNAAILDNSEVDIKDRVKLFRYANAYLWNGELQSDSLKEVKELIDKNHANIHCFPRYFIEYLHFNNVDFPEVNYDTNLNCGAAFRRIIEKQRDKNKEGGNI